MIGRHHITVCICTYKRAQMLNQLLPKIAKLRTENLFDYSLLVVDNDPAQSARDTVQAFMAASQLQVRYVTEPRVSISHARNRALEESRGDYLAFLDDDEYPIIDWLLFLYRSVTEFQTDGVLGPVIPEYHPSPPDWVTKSAILDRPRHKTGSVLEWNDTRSGNILLKRNVFTNPDNRFSAEFGHTGGEDKDLFYRLIKQGYRLIWCDEALIYEIILPNRWKVAYLMKRGLLRGQAAVHYPEYNATSFIRSMIALPAYVVLLPIYLVFSYPSFIRYVVKSCDHLGKLLAGIGIRIYRRHDYNLQKRDMDRFTKLP